MSVLRVPSPAGDGELQVTVDGVGNPVLALHGLLGLGQSVRAQLPPGYRVASYDQRGHGAGPRPDSAEGYEVGKFVADAIAVLDALTAQEGPDWVRPLLLGNSMGAGVALRLTMDQPSRVGRLVLVGPAFGDTTIAVKDDFFALADGVQAFGIEGFIPIFRASMIDDGLPKAATKWLDEWIGTHDALTLAAAIRAIAGWVPFPDLEQVAGLNLPLVVVSWPDDPIHPTALADRITELTGAASARLNSVADVLTDQSVVARCLQPLL